MSLHPIRQTPLKNPLATPPSFDCGPAINTGEVWASAFYGVTILHWGPKLAVRSASVEGYPAAGSQVAIEGFAWTVRWSDAEAAERDRQIAEVAASRAPQADRIAA